MKQLLKWVIPVCVLLLIGMWIGLNWNYFPANEEVHIPVVTKQEIKPDTAATSSVESDTTSTIFSDGNSLASEEESISAAIAAMDENAMNENQPNEDPTDELIESTPLPSDKDEKPQVEQSPVQPKKTIRQKTTKNVVEPSQSVIVRNRNSNTEQTTAAANRNLTPSPRVDVKSSQEVKANKEGSSNTAVANAATTKKQVEPISYMSYKQIPVDYLVEVDGSYKPAASGKGVGAATFIVYNRSGKNLKRVNMEVQYLGKGNQLLRKLEMPVSNISADGAVSVNVPANAEADRLVYKVLYVSSALGDFYYEPLQTYANALR
jgi:hypothetical protein